MKKVNIIFIIAAILAFAAAAVWPVLTSQPFPIQGMRPMVEQSSDASRVLQAVLVAACGLWLLVHPLQKSQPSLRLFQGIAVALAVFGFVRLGIPFGAIFCGFFLVAMQLRVHIQRRACPRVESPCE